MRRTLSWWGGRSLAGRASPSVKRTTQTLHLPIQHLEILQRQAPNLKLCNRFKIKYQAMFEAKIQAKFSKKRAKIAVLTAKSAGSICKKCAFLTSEFKVS